MNNSKKILFILGIATLLGAANANVQPKAEVAVVGNVTQDLRPTGYLLDVAKVMTNPVTRTVQQLQRMYTPIPFMGVLSQNIGADAKAIDKTFD